MSIGINTATRNALMTALGNAIDAGGAGGSIKLYSGARPATGGAVTTLLSTIPLAFPSFSVAGGVLTLLGVPLTDSSAAGTGTATWARIATSAGTFVADVSVSATGGGGDIQLSSASITAGQTVRVTSGTITEGNP